MQMNIDCEIDFNFKAMGIKVSKSGNFPFPVPASYSSAVDLMTRMLEVDPEKRFTADDALRHKWVLKYNKKLK